MILTRFVLTCLGQCRCWPTCRRRLGPRRVGAQKVGPEGWEAQNFALFSLSRHNFHSLFPLLGSFRGNLVVFGSAGALKCARREFTRQPENSKRADFRARSSKTPPKSNEKTPRERQITKMGASEGKTRAEFCAVRTGRVRGRGVRGTGVGRTPISWTHTTQHISSHHTTPLTQHNITQHEQYTKQIWLQQL